MHVYVHSRVWQQKSCYCYRCAAIIHVVVVFVRVSAEVHDCSDARPWTTWLQAQSAG